MRTSKRGLYVLAAGIVATAVVVAVVATLVAGEGGPDDNAIAPPLPSATAPPGVAPGEPTPPSSRDTPTSSQDTPTRIPPTWARAPGGTRTAGTMRVLAPIDAANVAILESLPPQYRLQVKAGLPSGCAKADGFEVLRSGNEIRVAVYNTLPTGNVACTAIYGTYDLSIDLGSSFTSGQEYRVNVNGTLVSFKAQ